MLFRSAVTLPESGNHSPKFHGLASFTSNTTISPSFNLESTSQVTVENVVAPAGSAPTSASTSQVIDHGQRQPDGSTPGDSTINAGLSQSILSQSILAGSANANMDEDDDDDDEPIPSQRGARERSNHQLDGSDDREDETQENNFPGTQFSAAMDISSPSRSSSPFRSIRPIATSTSAQPLRQTTPTTGSTELSSPSQAFKKKVRQPLKEHRGADNAGRDELAHSPEGNAPKSLPPPVNQFGSLKDRLASKKKGKAPKMKILAKRTSTSRRTKSMGESLPAKESTPKPREPNPALEADIGAEDVLFVSQSQSQTRSSRKRQSMPNVGQESGLFKVPSESQQIDLTLSDDEDLRGEIMHIPDAAEVDAADEFADKSKRRLVNRNERMTAHRRKAEMYNRRQTRG